MLLDDDGSGRRFGGANDRFGAFRPLSLALVR